MEENKQTNIAAPNGAVDQNETPAVSGGGVYNLGAGEKKPSILGKLLGTVFSPGQKAADGTADSKPTVMSSSEDPRGLGSVLGAAIGAQMAQETREAQSGSRIASIADLLGAKPEFNAAAYEEKERKNERRARFAFYAAVVFALIVGGYFYGNLTPDMYVFNTTFGQNSAQKFEQSNAEVKKLQTDINIIQYRVARLWFDILNARIDPYTQSVIASQTAKTLTERSVSQATVDKTGGEVRNALIAMQKIFSQDLGVDTYTQMPVSYAEREAAFGELLKSALADQKQSLRGSAKAKNDTDDERAIDNVIRLVGNKKVRALVRGSTPKTMKDEELVKLLADIRTEGIDEFAQVEKLKQQRIDWESLINNIHEVVKTADPHYGHGLFKTVGGFMFSNYNFNQKTGRVSITGITRTSDSSTFSFIATLIDAIEKSPKFKDIDFRSFSKTRDESGDFSAGVNLDFSIEK